MKLLLDENISRPAALALQNLVSKTKEPAEVRHLLETCPMGILDPEWLPKFQNQKNPWLIVTADLGKRSGGQRLPDICNKLRIRHVLISGKLHQRKQFDKMRAIMAVWPALKAAFESEPGSRFKLQQADKSFALRAV